MTLHYSAGSGPRFTCYRLLFVLQGTTYKAPFTLDVCFEAQHSTFGQQRFLKRLGALPIMVKSSGCHLRGMTRQQLVAAKEESTEFGGYFICNGIERIIRMLILQVSSRGPDSVLACCGRAAWAAACSDYTSSSGAQVIEVPIQQCKPSPS